MLPLTFPALPGPARDAAILGAVKTGDYEINWATITSDIAGHHAEFRVFADALKIGGVRVSVSAWLQQTLADMLGCSLLTAKLADLLFAQRAVTLPPHTQTPDATMVATAVMVKQSAWIDSQIGAAGPGIVQTVGKHWIIDNLFATNPATAGKALNYGWHMTSPTFAGSSWPKAVTLPNVWTIQNRGWAHAPQEVDYSQNCVLVARDCLVDGVSADLQVVLQDPELASLANADGVLRVLRQPGVPLAPPLARPPCLGPDCPTLVSWGGASSSSLSAGFGPIALVMLAAGFFGGLALERTRSF